MSFTDAGNEPVGPVSAWTQCMVRPTSDNPELQIRILQQPSDGRLVKDPMLFSRAVKVKVMSSFVNPPVLELRTPRGSANEETCMFVKAYLHLEDPQSPTGFKSVRDGFLGDFLNGRTTAGGGCVASLQRPECTKNDKAIGSYFVFTNVLFNPNIPINRWYKMHFQLWAMDHDENGPACTVIAEIDSEPFIIESHRASTPGSCQWTYDLTDNTPLLTFKEVKVTGSQKRKRLGVAYKGLQPKRSRVRVQPPNTAGNPAVDAFQNYMQAQQQPVSGYHGQSQHLRHQYGVPPVQTGMQHFGTPGFNLDQFNNGMVGVNNHVQDQGMVDIVQQQQQMQQQQMQQQQKQQQQLQLQLQMQREQMQQQHMGQKQMPAQQVPAQEPEEMNIDSELQQLDEPDRQILSIPMGYSRTEFNPAVQPHELNPAVQPHEPSVHDYSDNVQKRQKHQQEPAVQPEPVREPEVQEAAAQEPEIQPQSKHVQAKAMIEDAIQASATAMSMSDKERNAVRAQAFQMFQRQRPGQEFDFLAEAEAIIGTGVGGSRTRFQRALQGTVISFNEAYDNLKEQQRLAAEHEAALKAAAEQVQPEPEPEPEPQQSQLTVNPQALSINNIDGEFVDQGTANHTPADPWDEYFAANTAAGEDKVESSFSDNSNGFNIDDQEFFNLSQASQPGVQDQASSAGANVNDFNYDDLFTFNLASMPDSLQPAVQHQAPAAFVTSGNIDLNPQAAPVDDQRDFQEWQADVAKNGWKEVITFSS